MAIKIALLKSDEYIISDVKEVHEEEVFYAYLLKNPHKILTEQSIFLSEEINCNKEDQISEIEVSLKPWIILSEDTEIIIKSDWVVTFVEPITSIKNLYLEKINGQNNQVSFTES